MNLEELHVYWQSIIDSIEALENEEPKAPGSIDEPAKKSPDSRISLVYPNNSGEH